MTSTTFWCLFQETGDLMYYLLYRETLSLDETEEKTA